MLQNILNLEGVSLLDKKQQKFIEGGDTGSCGYTLVSYTLSPNGGIDTYRWTVYGVSKEQALQEVANGFSLGHDEARWCCDSCNTASWLSGEVG